ncbi:hypothetical protein MLD38_014886 [Melastoma candidum]|uniref:Uncharacterized protein n=1 Tax=Melastoma candidum TaxID=119954 RepID=A0ACB9RDJ3_9MYRT|nr:hypothetical protein MLD38_014886 [Melastoma candidum]
MAFVRHSSSLKLLLLFSAFLSLSPRNSLLEAAPQVPCYFVFGDSLSDNGNNNNLIALAKANYLPYGIDFPEGPTGRFTNGPNIIDYIAQLLGFDRYIQNFTAALANQDFTRGVNYASGAAGIRDETGIQQGDRISLNNQLLRHSSIVAKIRAIQGTQAADSLLNKCIYTVGMGNNDYINNYFMPAFYSTSRLYTPQQYAVVLANQYSNQLKDLHDLGARKVAILGPGLIGCAPQEVSTFGATNGSTCNEQLNSEVALFNNQLRPLVQSLNNQFPDSNFTLIDIFSISSSTSLAQLNLTAPCCETNPTTGTCKPNGAVCPDRKAYGFFDGYHPTSILCQGLASRSYMRVLPTDADPYDIRQLAMQ